MTVTVASITALVNLLVALQGVILMIYFATRRHIPVIAVNNIVILICSLSLHPLNAFTLLSGIASGDTVLQNLSNGMLAAIGPALFLHTTNRVRRTVRCVDLVHYIPALVVVVLIHTPLPARYAIPLPAIVFVQIGTYLVVTTLVIVRHAEATSAWLVTAIISTGTVVVLHGIVKAVFPVSEVVELNTTLLFAIPIFALLFDELGNGGTSDALRPRPPSRLDSAAEVRVVAAAITQYLDAGAYRRQNLTVREIAGDLGIPMKLVSSVVNSELGKSVPELIRTYRIEDVKMRLADPENDRYTILALASMSGFGSGPRFNTVFRQQVGVTPSEYKRRSRKFTS